jgi:hypothetical protein
MFEPGDIVRIESHDVIKGTARVIQDSGHKIEVESLETGTKTTFIHLSDHGWKMLIEGSDGKSYYDKNAPFYDIIRIPQ